MPRPLKRGILGASTIILSKDIDRYAFMCGSIFYETDVMFIYDNALKSRIGPDSVLYNIRHTLRICSYPRFECIISLIKGPIHH